MEYFQVTGTVRQKDGSEREETQVVRVPAGKTLADLGYAGVRGKKLPRAPREFEMLSGSALVVDEAGKKAARDAAPIVITRGEWEGVLARLAALEAAAAKRP